MTYSDSHVRVRDDSHTRVMGGTVASIRLHSPLRARGSASDTTKATCCQVSRIDLLTKEGSRTPPHLPHQAQHLTGEITRTKNLRHEIAGNTGHSYRNTKSNHYLNTK